MRYLSILPLLLITALLWGQDVDEKRMKRDIEVAEKILNELIQESSTRGFQGHDSEGAYIDGFGILFTIQSPAGVRGLVIAPEISYGQGQSNSILRGSARSRRESPRTSTVYRLSGDSLHLMDMDRFKQITETFLADYAYLLTQVPAGEKICIKYSKRKGMFPGWSGVSLGINSEQASPAGFTAVARQQAVQDYRREKIDRKTLVKGIEYTETEDTKSEQDRELVLLHSIFERLYQQDLSEYGFFLGPMTQMEKIAGLGAVFSYRFITKTQAHYFPFGLSTGQLERGQWATNIAIARTDEDGEENEEEEERPELEPFLEDFLMNVIEYGSTVRNLQPDEVLSFQLYLPDCNCDEEDKWPESVKIVAKQPVLESYRKGDIDLDEAVEQLQVSRL